MVPSKENLRLTPSGHFYTGNLFQLTITSCVEQWNDLLPVTLLFSLFTPWPAYPLKNLSQITTILHWQSWNGFPCSQGKRVTLSDPSLPKASPTTPLPAPGWCPAAHQTVAPRGAPRGAPRLHGLGHSSVLGNSHLPSPWPGTLILLWAKELTPSPPSSPSSETTFSMRLWECPWPAYLRLQ